MARQPRSRLPLFAAAAVVALTAAAFQPALDNGFLSLDDWTYVLENPPVLAGLSPRGFAWAFSTIHGANWHPLTWLSHMADVELFGLDPRGHHLTSLLVHCATALTLFAALRALTGAVGRSVAVAILFAIHPLHVESVAWVAERKDVLSGFFWAASLAAYVHYVRQPGRGRYALLLAVFAAGLMSKPMLVSLPFVLLLLDIWPLQRIDLRRPATLTRPAGQRRPAGVPAMVLEKLPLIGLAAASSIVTIAAQRASGAFQMMEHVSFLPRLLNALVSYGAYLADTLWPVDLVIFHPYRLANRPWGWDTLAAPIASAAILAALTALALRQLRRRPYLFVGWCWYLGTLVPVIGLIQVGGQARADRYTYLPLIGVFIAVVWAAHQLCSGSGRRRAVLAAAAVATVAISAALVVATRAQVRLWKDSPTIFRRGLDVHPGEWAPHHLYATAMAQEGRYPEAVQHAVEAARLGFDEQRVERFGTMLESRGRPGEALTFFSGVLRLRPENVAVRYRLADALLRAGGLDEAMSQYREVLRKDPGHGHAQNNLGVALEQAGRATEAQASFREAVRIDPLNAEAHGNLGVLLAREGRLEEAIRSLREAVRLTPESVAALRGLAAALSRAGQAEESARWAMAAQRAMAAQQRRNIELKSFHGRDRLP